jgi:methylmalonyl-CoA mutase N-terminal domain/subunit
MKEIGKKKEKWEKGPLKKIIKESGEWKEEFTTDSNVPVKGLYTLVDLEEKGFDYIRDLGFPGEYPYTRGADPLMHRGTLWTMSQYSGFGSAEDTNLRYKYQLEQGQTGLSVAQDLPTQLGYDSDHPLAHGEVGKVGVAIDSLRDMEIIFDGIPLNSKKIKRVSMLANAMGPVGLSWFIALAEKQGVSPEECPINLQNEILKEYIARGAFIFPPKHALRLTVDVIQYCSKNPNWTPINICGYHIREAGATAVQEVAFALANAITYIEETIKRGIGIDEFAHGMKVFLGTRLDLFEEVAKIRAARRMWAKIMKDRFGAKNPNSLRLRFTGFTCGSTLTAQQPMNNIIRTTIEALAAVLGGIQSFTVSSMDEALSIPSKEAVRIALRTQQIIAHESGIINTVDPLGGSYYIEALTNHIEEQAMKYIERIDGIGGAVKAIEQGFFQKEIEDSAFRYQKDIEDGKRIVVGVNKYIVDEQIPIKIFRPDPSVEKNQIAKLKRLKQERDNRKVREGLQKIKEIAMTEENLVPSILDAVRSYATVGEICSSLRDVFGEYMPGQVKYR